MNAYTLHDPGTAPILALLATAHFGIATVLSGRKPHAGTRVAGWGIALAAFLGTERMLAAEPAGLRMVALIVTLWFPFKVLSVVESRASLTFSTWWQFCLLWPGMDPRPFAQPRHSVSGWAPIALNGLGHLALGLLLFGLARRVWGSGYPMMASLLALPSLSLMVHFGVFDLLTAIWRYRGVDLQPPFRAPLKSTSLAEFWGRRWNCAFSEMASIILYQPLTPRIGRVPSRLGVFVFSGLLHEAAISVPVHAGYGGPFLYFLLHAWLVHRERATGTPRRPIPWVLLPLPLLFHRAFLAGTVWPLLR